MANSVSGKQDKVVSDRHGLRRPVSRSKGWLGSLNHTWFLAALIVAILALVIASPTLSQSYSFSLDTEIVDVFWQSDGTMSINYFMVFTNDSLAPNIEFIDIGLPNQNYDISSIVATINGRTISHIAPSDYVDIGVEVGLGSDSIRPGTSAQVEVWIGRVSNVLFEDSTDSSYASGRFFPSFFGSDLVHGSTDLTVRYHLPPGVQPDEPRWHESPRGWPSDVPETALDSDGRVLYIWTHPNANGSTEYEFGASFPSQYVPEGVVAKPSLPQQLGVPSGILSALACVGFILIGIVGFVALAVYSSRRRKLDYLPPKISIEGHGIKRGLTAVEAAVLLETPLDRVLTMILFSLIKKGAAKVEIEEPLKLARLEGEPKLRSYETAFLSSMIDEPKNKRRAGLQKVMIDLVKSSQKKMKGFSLKETRSYYRSIMKKAWEQVEGAETPEVKSELFGESLEWTMLDRDFDDRTREVFRTSPVYVPHWWWYYRPSTTLSRPSTTTLPSGTPGRSVTLPHLPGSDFAANIVNGVQNTASNLVTNVANFTNGVTKTTNPPPPPSPRKAWSSGGGGGGCACACACAGCACACAGGGR